MTAATQPPRQDSFNPDEYRMTIGEHLEELRRRLIIGLLGFAVMLIIFFIYGKEVLLVFCAPLFDALLSRNLNPQMFYAEMSESFMVYLKISAISAGAVASPWILYQLWLFVAAGLYPHERKAITRYIPMSVALLITGMLFVYFLVLPLSIRFFLDFAGSVPIPQKHVLTTQPYQPQHVPALAGDPASPSEYEIWFNTLEGRLKYRHRDENRVIPFGPSNLLAPQITLEKYISQVVSMLLLFGLSFQLPLVVMTLQRIGIIDVEQLRGARRYVYLILAVLTAVITPGDVVTAMIALMIPLILLYELGIWLAKMGEKE